MKKKNVIICIMACILLILCAVFIPGFAHKLHISSLERKLEIRDFEYASKLLNYSPKDIVDLIYNSNVEDKVVDYDNKIGQFNRAKNILQNVFDHIDTGYADTKKFADVFMDRCNLESIEEQTILVQNDEQYVNITLESVMMSEYEGDYGVYLFLTYESMTGTILSLNLSCYCDFYEAQDTYDFFVPDMSVIGDAVSKYYEERGIGEYSYIIEVGKDFFNVWVVEPDKAEVIWEG